MVFRLGFPKGDLLKLAQIKDKRISSWLALWNSAWTKKPMLDATMDPRMKQVWLAAWKRRMDRAGSRALIDMCALGETRPNWPIVILQSCFF